MDIKMQALDSSMAIQDLAFFIGIWYTIIKKPFSNPPYPDSSESVDWFYGRFLNLLISAKHFQNFPIF